MISFCIEFLFDLLVSAIVTYFIWRYAPLQDEFQQSVIKHEERITDLEEKIADLHGDILSLEMTTKKRTDDLEKKVIILGDNIENFEDDIDDHVARIMDDR